MERFFHRLAQLFFFTYVASLDVDLERRSTIYIPYSYTMGVPNYGLFTYPVSQLAYDHASKVLYTAGGRFLHAVNVSNPDQMVLLDNVLFPDSIGTDVEFCGGHVFVTVKDDIDPTNGRVHVFSAYTTAPPSLPEVLQIPVGTSPVMLQTTTNCSQVVVAVEGEVFENVNGTYQDEPGLIVIINFPTGINNNYELTSLNFTYYDDKTAELRESGVRHVFQEAGNPFSNDVEPEFVTITADDTTAYVSLQENNAIAVVDLVNQSITHIHGLGYKNWSDYSIDASDDDGGAMLYPYSVMGLYQPDSVVHFSYDGREYLAMANEGSTKNYVMDNYSFVEEERLERVDPNLLPLHLSATTLDQLSRSSLLGRLKVSLSPSGIDNTGRLTGLYAYGGRGFSVRDANTMEIVYDSGDDLAKIVLANNTYLFNSEVSDPDYRPFEEFDLRSDNKGGETETLTVGVVDGVPLLFVANERPGIIFCYSIESAVSQPVLQDVYDGIPFKREKSWAEMYAAKELSEIDPEDIMFVQAEESPTGKPILFAVGLVSGSVSIIDVNVFREPNMDSAAGSTTNHIGTAVLSVLVSLVAISKSGSSI